MAININMTKNEIIDFLNDCRESHTVWAEYFESNPKIEKSYVDTGEWDTAKTHRLIAKKYKETIQYIEVSK